MIAKKNVWITAAGLVLALAGCQAGDTGGNNGTTPTGNPIPTLSSMTPAATVTHMPAFTLAVTGSNFVDGARVVFNGTEMDTTFVSSTRLTCSVTPTTTSTASAAGDFMSSPQANTVTVRVRNPSPGGGESSSLDFIIHDNFTFSTPMALSAAGYDADDPQIWVSPDGAVDIVWTEQRGAANNPVFMRHSADGGQSWSAVHTIASGNCSGPTVCRDGAGTLHTVFGYATSDSVLRHRHSSNNGATWSTAATVPNTQVAATLYPVLRPGEGTTLHLVWRCNQVFSLRSNDAGDTWGPRILISGNPHRPSRLRQEVDRQGNLFVIWEQPQGQDMNRRRIWFSRSLDGGTTWMNPAILRSGDYEGLSHAAIVAATGQHLVSAWTWTDDYGTSTPRDYLELRFANILGNTWSSVRTMQPDGDFGMNPGLSADSAGNINLFMASGDIPYPQGSFQLRYIRSTDNGLNWTDSVLVKNLVRPDTALIESAADAEGHAFLVFLDNLGGYRRVYFARSEIPD